jgi:hypothetical protein
MAEPAFDQATLKRLANALAFISGADHPATVAIKTAGASGLEPDVKKARLAFLKLKSSDRQAALAMISGDD